MSRNIFFIFLLQILTAVTLGELSCNPIDNCKRGHVGEKVLDPMSCHNYYLCISTGDGVIPSDNPLPCPSDEYFNYNEGECLKECQPCASPCANRNCPTICDPVQLSLIAYPNDCTKYYLCVPGSPPAIVTCPESTPYFNGTGCSPEEYFCCDVCNPYCQLENTETLDPLDCTKYYLCLGNDTTPTEEQHFSCEKGKYFDSSSGHCLEDKDGEKCTSLCMVNVSLLEISSRSSSKNVQKVLVL